MSLSRKEIGQRLSRFVGRCRETGVRLTPQRVEVYRELASTEEHPDVETIFRRIRRRMPTVSRDTVYRTLCTLEEMGLVSRVGILSGPARFDANTEAHHHFVCRKCGLVRDFCSDRLDRLSHPPGVRRWGSVESMHLQVRGVCADCAGRGARQDPVESKKGTREGRR